MNRQLNKAEAPPPIPVVPYAGGGAGALDSAAPDDGRSSRVSDAYARLKAEILGNRLAPGFQTTEPDMAERLGMSRTPVREALIRLQSEGLVRLHPRRGFYVLPVSPDDMRDIYQLLIIMEPEAAAAVAQRGLRAREAARLAAASEAMEAALRKDRLQDWAMADDNFHRVLLGMSGNARLVSIVSTLFDQAHRARMITLYLRKKPAQSTGDHKNILKAMRAGNAQKTYALFRAHRERAAAELLSVLERCRLTVL